MDHKQYAAKRKADRIGKTILAAVMVFVVVVLAARIV